MYTGNKLAALFMFDTVDCNADFLKFLRKLLCMRGWKINLILNCFPTLNTLIRTNYILETVLFHEFHLDSHECYFGL